LFPAVSVPEHAICPVTLADEKDADVDESVSTVAVVDVSVVTVPAGHVSAPIVPASHVIAVTLHVPVLVNRVVTFTVSMFPVVTFAMLALAIPMFAVFADNNADTVQFLRVARSLVTDFAEQLPVESTTNADELPTLNAPDTVDAALNDSVE
jgi:hypothetical protein